LGISCVSGIYRDKDPLEALRLISEAGYRHVELLAPREANKDELKNIKEEMETLGLRASALCGVRIPPENISPVREASEVAEFLGASVLVGGLRARKGSDPELFTESVRKLEALLEERGMRFGFENHWGNIFADVEDGLRIMEFAGSERLGLTLDTGHFQWAGVDVAEAGRRLARYAVDVHAKDTLQEGKERLDRGRFAMRRMTGLGRGRVDMRGFVGELRRAGYRGFYSVEIEHVEDVPVSGRQDWLRESKLFLEELLG